MDKHTERIRELNDRLRCQLDFTLGRIMLTIGVDALQEETKRRVLNAIRSFKDFTHANDPYSEHDFGAVEVDGERYFFKIDYYDRTLDAGSEDPSDPRVTTRVMTVMQPDEY